MLDLAEVPIIICKADVASGNDKLFAHLLAMDLRGGTATMYQDYKRCHLHQNHLMVTSMIQLFGPSIISPPA